MIIDGHVKYRFVQRIMGMKDNKEINTFIVNNEFEVHYRIVEFVNSAELLIENYAPTRKDTLDYYINGEVLIIFNPRNKEIHTLYHITLDSENVINTKKIKQYVKTIKMNNSKVKHLKLQLKKQNLNTDHLEYMLKYLGEDVGSSVIEKVIMDRERSIGVCKELAAQEKTLRMENRELMSEMFIKLDMK
jgi:activator of 2-hydroxyglutaryl-CoA dehydratase